MTVEHLKTTLIANHFRRRREDIASKFTRLRSMSFKDVARGIAKVCARVAVTSVLFGVFIVAIQDVLIFPLVIPGLLRWDTASLPKNWMRHVLTSADGAKFEVFHQSGNEAGPFFGQRAILFHGNGGTAVQFAFFQQWLAHLGFSTYQMEFRGYGGSTGWPAERSLYQDAEQMFSFINEREKGAGKLLIAGISVGSGLATYLSTKARPDGLLLVSSYTSIADVARGLPLFAPLTPFLRFDFPAQRHVGELTDTCVVSVHGKRDETIPFAHQSRLRAAYRGSRQFISVVSEHAGHNDIMVYAFEETERALADCLRSAD